MDRINGGIDEWLFEFIRQGWGVPCQIVCCNCWLRLSFWHCSGVFCCCCFFFLAHIHSPCFAEAAFPARPIWYVTQNPTYKKLWFPHLDSRPSLFHWALDVWWSNPDIFYILMQNKQSQITHILPPYWFADVVNQIKPPFLFLSFRLTCALSGSVLARTLYWNSLKHRASFVIGSFFSYKVFVKKNRIFSPGLRSLRCSTVACLAFFVQVCSGKQSCPTHTVYHTRGWNFADFILDLFRFCLEYFSAVPWPHSS